MIGYNPHCLNSWLTGATADREKVFNADGIGDNHQDVQWFDGYMHGN
jgi:hypothetical protein